MSTHPSKSFLEKLTGAIERNNSLLCVGLDPSHLPAGTDSDTLFAWGQHIIEQTADLVCCYKPNIAFYEQYGPAGLTALGQIIAAVPDDIPVLLDAKRGDIGSTAAAYARAVFEIWDADAVTVNPYLGLDGIKPFLAYPGKMVFVICYTSNPSAATIQTFGNEEGRLFEHIIRQAQTWGDENQIAFVVGATQPHALSRFRELNQTHWILAPGVGAQRGNVSAAVTAGLNDREQGLIVPVSRAILYADDPRTTAQSLQKRINQARQAVKSSSKTIVHAELISQLHEVGCIQFGEFTLASGQQSPIYIDLRRMTAVPALLRQAALAYAKELRSLKYDHLAAVPYAALTIGTAVALAINRPLIYPRKEAKAYGTGKTVEGLFNAGDKVVIIEDLVTSGGSVLSAIEALEAVELVVSDVVVLIDREQRGRETLAKKGYHLHAALRMSEILDTLHELGRISTEEVEMVKRYLEA